MRGADENKPHKNKNKHGLWFMTIEIWYIMIKFKTRSSKIKFSGWKWMSPKHVQKCNPHNKKYSDFDFFVICEILQRIDNIIQFWWGLILVPFQIHFRFVLIIPHHFTWSSKYLSHKLTNNTHYGFFFFKTKLVKSLNKWQNGFASKQMYLLLSRKMKPSTQPNKYN